MSSSPTPDFGRLAATYDELRPADGHWLELADLLVHEATFLEEERDRARETSHSTALDAATIARDAGVSLLALTHLSNRYFGPEVLREAQAIFEETVVPRDFDIIDVRFEERGGPLLVKGGAKHVRREPTPVHEAVSIGEESS